MTSCPVCPATPREDVEILQKPGKSSFEVLRFIRGQKHGNPGNVVAVVVMFATKVLLGSSETMLKDIYYPAEGIGETYSACLKFLYGINDKLKKDGIMAPSDSSLSNTSRLYDLIGRPLDRIPTVHVGGTNGKGSTSFKIAESLRTCGLRTGLFVSPHLASFRERMQINAELISEDAFVQLLPTVLKLCADHSIPATLFELTFILACQYYEHAGCQVVVLEVGLGGELDATNVVNTAMSIICSVSLDHTRILGSTVEEIGTKKAGIFKRDVPALVGPGCPMEVMNRVASSRGAHLLTLQEASSRYGLWTPQGVVAVCIESECTSSSTAVTTTVTAAAAAALTTAANAAVAPTDGVVEEDTDIVNAQISYAALCVLSHTQLALGRKAFCVVADGLAVPTVHSPVHRSLCTRPPCRWEIHQVKVAVGSSTVPVTVVLDVGHNPAAVAALSRRIRQQYSDRPVRMLYAMSRDKDVRTCLKQVLGVVCASRIHFAQSTNFRAVSKEELSRIYHEESGLAYNHHIAADSVRDLIAKVIHTAACESGNSVVVICGTGFIMPDARAQLGIVEPRDDVDLSRVDASEPSDIGSKSTTPAVP